MSRFVITFLPADRSIEVEGPLPFIEAAALADIALEAPCGSVGKCGKCRVRFVDGTTPEPTDADLRVLSPADLGAGWRLACKCIVDAGATVEISDGRALATAKSFGPPDLFEPGFTANIRRSTVTLPKRDLTSQWSAEDALCKALGGPKAGTLPLNHLRCLAAQAAQGGGDALTAISTPDELLAVCHQSASGPSTPPLAGLAIDIGSTTLAVALVDLATGAVLGSEAALNPQVRFGADVVSRIFYARTNAEGNARLHAAVTDELAAMSLRVCGTANVEPSHVWLVCVAGNPAMVHAFAGVDVSSLGVAPFVGSWTAMRVLSAGEARLPINPEGRVIILPQIRSNVGADTVAAIVATGLDKSEALTLLIDLGTNSEVVLGNRERLVATSTAAGPAFEGANIACGMRAAQGAIDRVALGPDGRLAIHVIGGGEAAGLCGSGLVDAVAVLLRAGMVHPGGRLLGPSALDATSLPHLAQRLSIDEAGQPRVALDPVAGRDGRVFLAAADIRQLQLVKGSIRAGAALLLQDWGVDWPDVERVLIAGAFGQYIRKSSALDIGLVPPVDPERVIFVGNAAGIGARMALVDRTCLERARHIHRTADYLECGGKEEFQDLFGELMGFHDSPVFEE